jgi:wnt family
VLGLSRPVCASLPPDVRLTATQSKLCVLYPDHMFVVVQGAQLGLEECRWQFRADRWNCSTPAALLDTSDNFTSTWTTTPHHNSVLDDDDEQQTTALNGSSVAAVIALAELLTPSITIGQLALALTSLKLTQGPIILKRKRK